MKILVPKMLYMTLLFYSLIKDKNLLMFNVHFTLNKLLNINLNLQ